MPNSHKKYWMVYDIGEPRDSKKLVNLGCHVICFRDLTSCFFLMLYSSTNMLRNLSTSKLVKVCNLKAIKYLLTLHNPIMYLEAHFVAYRSKMSLNCIFSCLMGFFSSFSVKFWNNVQRIWVKRHISLFTKFSKSPSGLWGPFCSL